MLQALLGNKLLFEVNVVVGAIAMNVFIGVIFIVVVLTPSPNPCMSAIGMIILVPVGPVDPVGPMDPVLPVGPVDPVSPVGRGKDGCRIDRPEPPMGYRSAAPEWPAPTVVDHPPYSQQTPDHSNRSRMFRKVCARDGRTPIG